MASEAWKACAVPWKLARMDLNVIGIIGIILLIGIVKKNAIMMIDFALEAERVDGKSPAEAIYQACVLRFRPIMMTTMAALLGALPLALGRGIGSELRRPLGIAIVGGLIVSQALTLYTTPVVYLYLDGVRLWWARGAGHGRPLAPAATPDAVDAIDAAFVKLDPPPAMRGRFQGAAAVFRDSLSSQPFLILPRIVLMIITYAPTPTMGLPRVVYRN